MSFGAVVSGTKVRSCLCQGGPAGQGEPHHGGARADTRGRTREQWRWVQRSPSRRTYRRTRYRRGLRWAWGPEVGRTYCALHTMLFLHTMLLRLRPQALPCPAPPMGSSPPGFPRALLITPSSSSHPKAPPIPQPHSELPRPKRVPRARASHSASDFLGATPNLTRFAARFRLHRPVWRWPVSSSF